MERRAPASASKYLALVLGLIALFAPSGLYANKYRSFQTGPWNLTSTWEQSISGGAWVAATGTPGAAGDTVQINFPHTVTTTAVVTTVDSLTVSGALTIGGFNFTVSGNTGIYGTLTHNNTAGTKTFTGLVTVNGGGIWDNTANEAVTFRGGITNNGTFNAGTGVHTFDTNKQTLNGILSIPSVTVTAMTLTNNGTLTVGTALSGTGRLSDSTNATLNIGGTSAITGMTATATGNTVNYTGAAQTVHSNTYYHLNLSGSGAKTLQAGTTTISGNLTLSGTATTATVVGLTITGNLSIGNGTTFTAAGFNLTVTGTTTVGGGTSGILTISSATGIKIFTGLVTLNVGSTWNNTAANEAVTFRGGITNNGTFNAGTGVHTFDTYSQNLNGRISIPSVTVTGAAVVLTNNGWLTVGTALSGTGGLTQADLGDTLIIGGTSGITTLTATVAGNVVNYSGAAQTVHTGNYHHLLLSGSAAKTLQTGTTTIGGDLILSGTATTATVVGLAITGNLSIGNGTTFTAAGFNLTVTGTTTVGGGTSGILTISSATGTKTFTGLVTLNVGSTWNNTAANSPVTFRGGITNYGTINPGTGVYTFDTNNQDLNGRISIPSVTVTVVTLTNNGWLTVGTALSGTGGLTQAAAGDTLIIGGTSAITTLTATASGNVVNYSGAAQTVHTGNYHHLILSGSAAKTLQTGTTAINGALTFSGTASATGVVGLSVGDSVVIGTGTTFTAGAYTHNVGGNWSNSGTFTGTGSTINLNGTTAQRIRGTTTTSFNNLTISNTTAAVAANTNFNVAGTMTVNANAILDPDAAVVINTAAAAGTITGSGTIRVSRIAATADYVNQYKFTTNTLTSLTVEYVGAGAQTVNNTVGNYGGLIISGSGTKSLQGAVVVAGDVTLNAGALDVTAGNFALSVGGNWSNNGGTFTPQNGLVTFNGSGAQSITGTPSTQSFANLTISKSAGTLTVTGSTTAVSLSGAFAMNSGTFTAPTTMTVAGAVTLSGGTWNAGSTTNVAGNWTNNTGATFNSGDGTVVMNGSSIQTIGGTQSTTFRSLTISNSAGVGLSNTITLSKNPPSGGNLTINTGTLSDNGYQITGNDLGTVTIANGAGLTLGTTGLATQFPTNYLSVNCYNSSTVTYNSDQPQPVYPVSSPGYGIISFGGGGTKTLSGPLIAQNGLTIATNTTLDDAGNQISGAGTLTMQTGSSLKLGSTSTATTFPSGFGSYSFASPSTVVYNSNQAQTISSTPTYRTLSLASTATVTKTADGAITADNLTVGANNTFDGVGYVLTVNNDVTNSGMITGTGSGKVKLTGTVEHQLGGNGTYYKLQLANTSNGATLIGSPTISDSLVLTTGNLTVGANTLTLNGPKLDSAETKIVAGATSSFVFGGNADTLYMPKNISAVKNLTVNMHTTDSKLNHSAPLTINDTLTLTLGSVDMFQYPNPPTRVDTLTIASTGSINIVDGRVKGGLRRWVPTSGSPQTISWPVGGADVKTQVDITFKSVTAAGWLTIRMFASDHPLINSSGINPTKSVNRYWKVRNDGIVFDTASVTLNYAGTSDVDAGANWNSFGVSRYDPITASWAPLGAGTRTSTSTQGTGCTLFGDFQIGEPGEKIWTGSGNGTTWEDGNNWSPIGVPSNVDAVKIRSAANISISSAASANSLVLNNSGLTLTIGATYSLTIASGLTDSAGTLKTLASFPSAASVSLLGGTVEYAATTGSQNVSAQSYNNLVFSGNATKTMPGGTVNIAGNFTVSGGSVTPGSSTVVFNGTGAQSVAATNYNNLTVNGSGTKTVAAGTATVGGTLDLAAGTLDVGTSTLTLNSAATATSGVLTSSATGNVNYNQGSAGQSILAATYGNLGFSAYAKTLPSSGTISIAGTFTPAGSGHTITGSTIDFNGSGAQTISAFAYNNLTISGSRGGAAVTLVNGGTIQVAGTFNPSATSVTYTTWGNTFEFNGGSVQTAPAFTFKSLKVNNSSGVTLSGNVSVDSVLTLTSGNLTTSANILAINPSGAVTRPGGGFIVGNLQKNFSTGASSRFFEVGTGGTFAPVNITFANVTGAGDLVVSTTAGEHPQIATSSIDQTKDVNRYWTITNSGVTFSAAGYTAVFSFVPASDKDAGADASVFIANRYSGTWNNTTNGTRWTDSTQIQSELNFGDFVVGQQSGATTIMWDGGAGTSNWGDDQNWDLNRQPTSGDNVVLSAGSATSIDINVNASSNNLTINSSNITLTLGASSALHVYGSLNVSAGTFNTLSSFPTVDGAKNVTGGTFGYTASGAQNVYKTSYFNLNLGGSGAKTVASGDTVWVGGDFTIGGSATATTTGSTIVFNGSSSQAIAATTYNNLTINGSGTKTLASGTTTVGGTLTLTAGTLDVAANTLTLNGTVTKTSGALTSQSTGTVNYNQGSGGQAVLAGTYGNLTFSAQSKTLASSGAISISGTFTPAGSGHTVTGSTVDFNAASGSQTIPVFTYNNLTVSGAGSKSLAAGTLTVSGNLTASGGAVATSGSTVDFNASTGSQSIAALNYNNLTFSNAGTRVFASGSTTGVAGTLTVSGGSVTTTGSTIDFNGGAQSIPALTYANLTLSGSGTKTLSASTTTINGNFSLGGTAWTAPNGGTVVFTNTSGSQSIAAAQFYNLTLSGNSTKTFASGATTSLSGSLSVSGGSVTTTGSTIEFNASTGSQLLAAINYNNIIFTNAGDRTFNSGTTGIAGSFTGYANGTIDVTTNSSLIEYNGSSTQTIAPITYWQMRTNNSAGFNLNSGNAEITSLLYLQSGNITTGSNQLVLTLRPPSRAQADGLSAI